MKNIRTTLFLLATLALAASCDRKPTVMSLGVKTLKADTVCRTLEDGIWACISAQHVYLCVEEDGDVACGTFGSPSTTVEKL